MNIEAPVAIQRSVNRLAVLALLNLVTAMLLVIIGSVFTASAIVGAIDAGWIQNNMLLAIAGIALLFFPTHRVFTMAYEKIGLSVMENNGGTLDMKKYKISSSTARASIITGAVFVVLATAVSYIGGSVAIVAMVVNDSITVFPLAVILFAARYIIFTSKGKSDRSNSDSAV